MASPQPAAVLLVFFFCSTLAPFIVLPCAADRAHSIGAELLRGDSLDDSMTTSEKVRSAVRRSGERVRYWASLAKGYDPSRESTVSLTAKLAPATFEYLMEISLGTPPATVLVVPDTGSDLIWTKCASCRNCTGEGFNPRKSSSYKHLRCDSRPCTVLETMARCGLRHNCDYALSYGDGSSSAGVLSRETFIFNSTGGRNVSFPKVVFGCSHRVGGAFNAGILGLGRGPLSLISQLGGAAGGKFSYCLAPITDSRAASYFNLGPAAAVDGANVVTTPIVSPKGFSSSFYYLSLHEVTVEAVRIPAEVDIIIDSGTAVTFLPDGVVNALVAALSTKIPAPRVHDPEGQFELCYRVGSTSAATAAFPEVVFGFGGGKVALKPANIFVTSEDGVVCLSVLPSPSPAFAIFGFLAQQNFHVGYDLVKNTVSLAPADCAHLRLRKASRGKH
ncbi:unnamed protein product [Spirodela intermedia]|uniref:Peptidase A1 domain-containing protein n=1 Tax=Spirodela intermedia TaxID=51605 RepID=A0A7I8LB99_SPIIN|nr:unnamed protein product [Spirodela intermedia]